MECDRDAQGQRLERGRETEWRRHQRRKHNRKTAIVIVIHHSSLEGTKRFVQFEI